jgi:hypothetical protein
MTIVPMNTANMTLTLQNDAQQLRTLVSWIEQRYTTYNTMMNSTNLTAASITGADQTAALALAADFGRLKSFVEGVLPAVASDIRVDVINIIGVM